VGIHQILLADLERVTAVSVPVSRVNLEVRLSGALEPLLDHKADPQVFLRRFALKKLIVTSEKNGHPPKR
jgi:hypothetical protein